MAITTLDGLIAGMQWQREFAKAVTPTLVAGRPHSLTYLAGNPGTFTADTTLNGVALSSSSSLVNGQIHYNNPGSGNGYVARFEGQATIAGRLLLCDRLWHNGGYTITSTSAQNSTTPTWPSRDVDAATSGKGVLLALEVSAATGAGTPTITCAYTNSGGTGSRSATNVDATVASSAIGAFYRIGLQAGDVGVQSLQSVTLSATWTSGTMNMVAYRVLASVSLTAANTPNWVDPVTGMFPRIPDGAVPFLVFIPSTTTASNISGSFTPAHG